MPTTSMRTSLVPPSTVPARSPTACTTCGAAEVPRKEETVVKDDWVAGHQKEIAEALDEQKRLLEAKKTELERNDATTKANLRKFFGDDSEQTRTVILARVNNQLALNSEMKKNPAAYFQDARIPNNNRFASVFGADATHQIYVDRAFQSAAVSGKNSRAGTLIHEMSHFSDVGGTRDKIYGTVNSLQLAKDNPSDALQNADNFEYYAEATL